MLRTYFRFNATDQHLHPVGRLELFGDGILAIAATLLVLNLSIPATIGAGGLRHVLFAQRFTFVAVLIGFFEIGGSWLMSRRLARIVEEVDHWLTLLWMGAVFTTTLIPFTTLLLARSFDRSDFGFGVMCVSSVTWLALVFTTATVLYARRAGLLRPSALPTFTPYLRIISLADVIWTVAVPLSLLFPWVGFTVVVLGYATGMSPLPTEGKDAPNDLPVNIDE